MEVFLNKKSLELHQGAIRAMFDRARYFPGAINLGIGEPDMHTPDEIIEEGRKALLEGKTHYTPNAGILELREEIARYLEKFDVAADPETEIIVTAGGMGALSLSLLVTLSEGDEVLIQDPQWLNYYSQVRFFGGVPIAVPVYEKNEFRITAEDIKKRITSKTKVIMLNSPNNPTGAVLEREDLESIAQVVREHNLLVISDEVYSTLLYDGVKHMSIASLEGMRERTIVVNSFSKSFAMTGWRVGYAAGSKELIDKMTRLQENLVACVNGAAQYAAIKALKSLETSEKMTEIYRKRRDIIVDGLNEIEGITCCRPKGSFYVFANIQGLGKDEVTVANELLEKAGVIAIPGSAFGEQGKGYLRMAYANSEENLREAVKRIKNYVESLK